MKKKVLLILHIILLISTFVLAADIVIINRSSPKEYDTVNETSDTSAEVQPDNMLPPMQTEHTEDEKTIYLTFDDGPYMYTERLLDILDEHNVKATFFVTCQNEDYINLIAEEYERGHAIGIHSFSHKYKTIYRSDVDYHQDFSSMQQVIKELTGSFTRLYRFPGGSSNTVSKYYNEGIVTRAVEFLDREGYAFFDWNITSGDSEGLDTKEEIVQSVINQIEEAEDAECYIVLQHDIFECSVEATEEIIKWGLENGYKFDKLNYTSPTVHFEVAN